MQILNGCSGKNKSSLDTASEVDRGQNKPDYLM